MRVSPSVAGLPGLEPGKAGPESAVLPLHHSPVHLLKSGAKIRLFSGLQIFWHLFCHNDSEKEMVRLYAGHPTF